MSAISNQMIVLIILTVSLSLYILSLLAPILTPFLMGALLAYLADPLVKQLEKFHIPHLLSVISVFLLVFGGLGLMILMLTPVIQDQIVILIDLIPKIISWLQVTAMPRLSEYINTNMLKTTLSSKSSVIFSTVIHSGYTFLTWLVNIILTPVVTFYFLRDWDKILSAIKGIFPKSIKTTVIKLATECDEVLGAFFRGQFLVMLALSFIYGIGLTLIGIRGGFIIGVIAGMLSIVPYLGSIFVVVIASLAAIIQFETWHSVLWVLLVYLIGQSIESYVLTPYLVGNRIGLHPVAVIFSIMAGGTLFGFFGVLVALPVAAVIMVILRFINNRYIAENKVLAPK